MLGMTHRCQFLCLSRHPSCGQEASASLSLPGSHIHLPKAQEPVPYTAQACTELPKCGCLLETAISGTEKPGYCEPYTCFTQHSQVHFCHSAPWATPFALLSPFCETLFGSLIQSITFSTCPQSQDPMCIS